MRVPFASAPRASFPSRPWRSCSAPARPPTAALPPSPGCGQRVPRRAASEPVGPPSARHGNRLTSAAASRWCWPAPSCRASRRTLGFRVAGKIDRARRRCRRHRQAGRPDRPLDPADFRLAVDNARAALASAEADYARAKADHERYLNLRGSAAFTPQTLEQRQSLAVDHARPGRAGQKPALLGREQPRLHRAARRRRRRRHRRPGRGRPGAGAGPGRRAGRPHRRARDPGRRARAPAEDRARSRAAASFELWSDPGHRHAAKLRELSPSADPMTRTYPARFSVIEPPTSSGSA